MVVRVALPLVATPLVGWERLRLALAANELPRGPHAALASAGLASVAATALGWSLRPGSTTAGAVLHVLAASLAYVGGPLLAIALFSSFRGLPAAPQTALGAGEAEVIPDLTWFVVAATLPVSLSGLGNVVPVVSLSITFALAFAGAALSARSSWVGASAMLALAGQARIRAAAAPAGLAASVALLATSIRMVLPS